MTGMNPPASPSTMSPKSRASPEATPDAAPVEIDEALPSDADSTFDDELSSYTASLTSSVLNYPVEYGRRYHAYQAGSYAFPNDEAEKERLDLTHMLMTKGIGNKLFLAPVDEDKTRRILDIGTGTGIWAIQMGEDYPGAEVLGNDLSAIQPSWVPPNVKFEIDDVEKPWVNGMFDFIFSRYMAASILDWPKLVGKAYNHLNPGGWAEFQDFDFQYYSEDGSFTDKHDTMKWANGFLEAAKKIQREPSPGPKLERWFKEAGFQNVVHRRFRFPIGPWPKDAHMKDVGLCTLASLLDGLEAISMKLFCGVLGWPEEEVLVLLAKVRSELKTHTFHAQFDFHVVYGQKPPE
ncbi:methyltransferase domain-containing protein [Dactylonectria macrodidyma]|uniref:Methyltransferase domain-containing protein n=1 Tax=Dactylonectria macrodidyma TaxID=307937 RepID=A0A9P9FVK3_9HYPO|nr:methyltransferase domain-containing protein [Dactylonectria macrodidyma]